MTGALADDLDDGVAYSQFRLQLPFATDADGSYDTVQFARDSFVLTVIYIAD